MEVFWGDFLEDSMAVIYVEVRRVHDGTMWTSYKVVDEVLDALERWYGGSSSVA